MDQRLLRDLPDAGLLDIGRLELDAELRGRFGFVAVDIFATERGVCALRLARRAGAGEARVDAVIEALARSGARVALRAGTGPHVRRAERQLAEYLRGRRREFELALDPDPAGRATPFQRAVWAALARIPYGETCSYAELARRAGRPLAARAVGQANGRNPLPIVVPCHRVIAADGGLGGFTGGVDFKRELLRLERAPAGASASA